MDGALIERRPAMHKTTAITVGTILADAVAYDHAWTLAHLDFPEARDEW